MLEIGEIMFSMTTRVAKLEIIIVTQIVLSISAYKYELGA